MSESELRYHGKRFDVYREIQITPDGARHTRDIVRHPGAVAILPVLDDGRICLIRNYRISVNEALLELPAGTLERGEDPQHCAERELIEETGYRAKEIKLLTWFYMSPGVLDEKMYLYLATGLEAGDAAREAGEDIENLLVTWDEAAAMMRDGRIHEAKTMVGLLYWKSCGG